MHFRRTVSSRKPGRRTHRGSEEAVPGYVDSSESQTHSRTNQPPSIHVADRQLLSMEDINLCGWSRVSRGRGGIMALTP